MVRALRWAMGFALACACSTTPRTEVVLVVDSDLDVPAELDRIEVTVTGPDARMEMAMALLGDGEPVLPRTLGLVHGGDALGPFQVEVVGTRGGLSVVSRSASFAFVRRETRVLTMHLVRSCIGASCGAGSTCGERGCESISRGSLPEWTGEPPRLGDTPDAGMDAGMDASFDSAFDACMPTSEICDNGIDDDCDDQIDESLPDELCNGVDDDCDVTVDEGFDLLADPMNCGTCGRQCVFRNGEGLCNAGNCQVTACNPGFDDCDGNPDNGCETDLAMSASHCGACGNRCVGGRSCCPSTMTCLRASECP